LTSEQVAHVDDGLSWFSVSSKLRGGCKVNFGKELEDLMHMRLRPVTPRDVAHAHLLLGCILGLACFFWIWMFAYIFPDLLFERGLLNIDKTCVGPAVFDWQVSAPLFLCVMLMIFAYLPWLLRAENRAAKVISLVLRVEIIAMGVVAFLLSFAPTYGSARHAHIMLGYMAVGASTIVVGAATWEPRRGVVAVELLKAYSILSACAGLAILFFPVLHGSIVWAYTAQGIFLVFAWCLPVVLRDGARGITRRACER
jgi:hypothetical protein